MKIIVLFFLFLSVALCQSPKWYSTGSLPAYSRDAYIIGLGEGNTLDEAQTNAQAAISAQINVNIESTIQVFTKESSVNDESEFTEDFQRLNKSYTSETLKGVEIIKSEANNGRYYAFAVLDKSQFFRGLRRDLDMTLGMTESMIRQARGNINQGNVFSAIENYSEAYENILKHYDTRSLYDAVSKASYTSIWVMNPAEVIGEIQKVLSSVKLEIVSGNNQQGISGAYLPSSITCLATVVSEDGRKIPISKMPVNIKSADRQILFRLNTDSDGVIEFPVSAIPINGNSGYVTAEIRLTSLSSSFKKYLQNSNQKISYTISDNPITPVSLMITDESGHRLDKLERKITKSLTSLNYSVTDDATLRLEGTVTKTEAKEVEGARGLQYLVNTELDMELLVADTKERFAAAVFSGTGLSNRSASDAFDASVLKIKLNRKEISELMYKAADKIDALLTEKSQNHINIGKAYYAKGEFEKAISELIMVNYSQKLLTEASGLIDNIRQTTEKKEADRIARIEAEKEKERALQLEEARLAAETEQARIEVDREKRRLDAEQLARESESDQLRLNAERQKRIESQETEDDDKIPIQTIVNIINPAYIGSIVSIEGTVIGTIQIGILSGFTISDGTETIKVSSKSLPQEGDKLKVSGRLIKDFFYGYYIEVND